MAGRKGKKVKSKGKCPHGRKVSGGCKKKPGRKRG